MCRLLNSSTDFFTNVWHDNKVDKIYLLTRLRKFIDLNRNSHGIYILPVREFTIFEVINRWPHCGNQKRKKCKLRLSKQLSISFNLQLPTPKINADEYLIIWSKKKSNFICVMHADSSKIHCFGIFLWNFFLLFNNKYAEVASIVLLSEVNWKVSSFTHKLQLEEIKVSRSMVVSYNTQRTIYDSFALSLHHLITILFTSLLPVATSTSFCLLCIKMLCFKLKPKHDPTTKRSESVEF